MSVQFYINQNNGNRTPNTMELLGYAKRKIVQAMQVDTCLPYDKRKKLSKAYDLLDEVENFLHDTPSIL